MRLFPKNSGEIVKEQRFYLPVLASVFSLSGVSLIAPALPVIAEGLSLADQGIGLLITSFTLPAVFILPFSGFLSDTIGRNRVLGTGCVILGAAGVATVFTDSLAPFLGLRAVQGAGFALVMPVTVALLGDAYDADQETAAQGLRTSLNKVGKIGWLVLGGVLAGLGWKYVFFAYAGLIPLGIWIYQEMRPGVSNTRSPSAYLDQIVAVSSKEPMAMFLSIGFVRMFLKYTVITFLPLLLSTRYGLPSSSVGVVMATIGVGGILTAAYAGEVESLSRKTSTIFTAFVIIGLVTAGIGVTDSLIIVVMLAVLLGAADALLSPLHKSLLTRNVDPAHRTGIVAANSMGQNLGKTVAPTVMGVFLVWGFTPLFVVGGVAAAMSGAGYFLLRHRILARTDKWHHPAEL